MRFRQFDHIFRNGIYMFMLLQKHNQELKPGRSGSEVIKLFPSSTQLSMKFQLLIITRILTNKDGLSDAVFIMLINIKMPTVVGILTFMSRINFVLS